MIIDVKKKILDYILYAERCPKVTFWYNEVVFDRFGFWLTDLVEVS